MKSINHILFLTPGFPAHENDSNCIPALQIYIKNFKKYFPQINCSVITIHYPYSSLPYLWNGISVYPCNGKNKGGVNKMLTWRKANQYFNSLKRLDIIHSFWLGEACLLGQRFAKKSGLPHITTLMGQDALDENSYLKFLNLSSIKIVSPSLFSLNKLKEHTSIQPGIVISWGTEEEDFKTDVPKTIDILGAGSLIKLKRFDLFVEVVSELVSDFPEIKTMIIGDGTERKKIKKLIKEKNLDKHIQLIGEVPHVEVLQFMNKSKILFHTSSYESFGMVFAEALQAGMKIVSLKTGCYFENNNWLGVDNANEFNLALRRALNSSTQSETINHFPIRETCQKYYDLYYEEF